MKTIATYDLNEVNFEVIKNQLIITSAFDAMKWAKSVLNAYFRYYTFSGDYDVVYASSRPRVYPKVKVGYAVCSPNDDYIWEVGCAIALCRAEGLEIPSEIFYG